MLHAQVALLGMLQPWMLPLPAIFVWQEGTQAFKGQRDVRNVLPGASKNQMGKLSAETVLLGDRSSAQMHRAVTFVHRGKLP